MSGVFHREQARVLFLEPPGFTEGEEDAGGCRVCLPPWDAWIGLVPITVDF